MIALFDFDGTLLPERNSLYWHLVREIPDRPWRLAKTVALTQALAGTVPAVVTGVIDEHLMFKLVLAAVFTGLPVELADAASDRLAVRVEASLYPEARRLLDDHADDDCYLVTSNTEPIVSGFCRRRGLTPVATRLHVAGGRYTGLVDGELNRSHEKVARVRGAGIDPASAVAYGNSLDDEPLLAAAGRPVLVDADADLAGRRQLRTARRVEIERGA